MDDMFEDLLSPPKKQPDPPPATQQQGGPEGSVPGGTSENGSVKHQQGGGDGKDAEHQPQAPGLVGVSKEELHSLVSVAVEGAMDNLLGKFVKSLRTVLEDLGKRVDQQGARLDSHSNEMKGALGEVLEQLESQAQNVHSRFTTVDMALKEVDRGVQALRDKQELMEAQATLARFSHADSAPQQQQQQQQQQKPGAGTQPAVRQEPSESTPPAAAPAAAPSGRRCVDAITDGYASAARTFRAHAPWATDATGHVWRHAWIAVGEPCHQNFKAHLL
mmetsp:Transcript_21412/g.59329  ORF Transcript_21412/g.59329 Transcript_21412/m.59329 type:complete len:275 (-) Transcript_21412:105-929(-)